MRAYGVNVEQQTSVAIEESPVGQALRTYFGPGSSWEGTTSDLLALLNENGDKLNFDLTSRMWPKASNILSRRLNEIAPDLRRTGIDLVKKKIDGVWHWIITCKE